MPGFVNKGKLKKNRKSIPDFVKSVLKLAFPLKKSRNLQLFYCNTDNRHICYDFTVGGSLTWSASAFPR